MRWTYSQPVEVVFEFGAIQQLDALCAARGYRKAVLICDPYFAKSGLADKLKEYSGGRIAAVYAEVTPNPRVTEVDKSAELLREVGADFGIALGGGSAIDCAKMACAISTSGFSAYELHSGEKNLNQCGGGLPLIVIPTTAGTGSEVTSVAVLTDDDRGVKAPINHPSLFPKLAIIDPELTISLPPQVTAASGLDALSHALEGFWSKGHQPICDAMALHAARLVFDNLLTAYTNGGDVNARERMCEASLIAGLAFALPKTAASHAISFPLTNKYGLPHGEACAFTLDKLCVINAEAEDGRLNDFAAKLGFKNAAEMAERIASIKKQTGMRTTLADAKIGDCEIGELVKFSKHPNLANNPVALDDNALKELFLSLR